MTKREMVEMGMEYRRNYYGKYMVAVEKQYKYRGKIKTRKTYEMTEKGIEISNLLDTPMFICPRCGQKVSFNDLEVWSDDTEEALMNDEIVCSLCYEEEMGDDL